MQPLECDVLVVGDEVESILTAVSAARAGIYVVLARRSEGRLGGLSVRGGLSYMDITPEFICGLFGEFLKRTGLIRVALNPEQAHDALTLMLEEAGILVISGVETQVSLDEQGFPAQAILMPIGDASGSERIILPGVVIDATPDGDVMRSLGVPYILGLGGILGPDQNFLGVSPVFRLAGVEAKALQEFEASLRARSDIKQVLDAALPYHPAELRAEYVTRPTYSPPLMDYLDILNPTIGIYYHVWREARKAGRDWNTDAVELAGSYADAEIFIDGFNTSRLCDRTLGMNGLVCKASAVTEGSDEDVFDDLVAMSQGGPIPGVLTEEMQAFERWLREVGDFANAKVIPPEELYIRQTCTLLSRNNMTARMALQGGVPADYAIGTFSYWLDLRGTQLWRQYPGEHLAKPVFHVGLDVALPLAPTLQNIAFVGRSAGYSPIGQGTGRIVQHNAMLGEGLGIAAALAVLGQSTLESIAETAMPQIQAMLKARWGELKLSGRPTARNSEMKESRLLNRDDEIVRTLRAQAADFTVL